MGKLVAYLGPRTPAATVIEAGSSAFVRQAADYPDGFGLGWFPDDEHPGPVRQLHREPPTSVARQLDVPRRYRSHCIAAAVQRAQTPAAAVSGAMPLATDRLLYCQVAELAGFDVAFRRPLTQRLSDPAFRGLRGFSPSEVLFATFNDLLGTETGHDAIADALQRLVDVVSEVGLAIRAPSTLAVVIADGAGLVALRTSTQGLPPPLYTVVAQDGDPLPMTGRIIASEPLFAGPWSALEPNSLTIFSTEAAAASPARPPDRF